MLCCRVLVERGLYARLRIERGGDIGAACGQLALTSTTAAQKIYEESGAAGSSGGTTAAVVNDIEDLGCRQQNSRMEKPLRDKARSVAQPGGAPAVDRWRKRDVSSKQTHARPQAHGRCGSVPKQPGLDDTAEFSSSTFVESTAESVHEELEDGDSTSAPAWTPPDGFLNQAEVRQLIQQLSASTPTGRNLGELSTEQLRQAMQDMDPEGQGVRVGVSSFAAWWEQQQHLLHDGSDTEGHVFGCCVGGQHRS